jgi:hypothetical protein
MCECANAIANRGFGSTGVIVLGTLTVPPGIFKRVIPCGDSRCSLPPPPLLLLWNWRKQQLVSHEPPEKYYCTLHCQAVRVSYAYVRVCAALQVLHYFGIDAVVIPSSVANDTSNSMWDGPRAIPAVAFVLGLVQI